MSRFKASTKYLDFEGTAAADMADQGSLSEYLKQKSLMFDTEFLVGCRLSIGENHSHKVGAVFVEAYLMEKGNFDTVKAAIQSTEGEIPVREVVVDINLDEFVGLFKRFEVVLTREKLELTGRDYRQIESH